MDDERVAGGGTPSEARLRGPAGGGEEEKLGFGGPAVGVALQHEGADFLGPRAAAGFAGKNNGFAFLFKPLLQKL